MHIAIIGAGGIGAYYGARLQQGGHDVTFVARGTQLAALQADGLRVEHPEFSFSEPVQAVDMATLCAGEPATFDVLMLAVKSGATADIATGLQRWFDARGQRVPLLSLQNGVDNEATLAAKLGDDLVIGGHAVRIGTHVAAPGHIEASGAGQVTVGLWPNAGAAPDGMARRCFPALLTALSDAGVPVEESTDIRRELWRKLVLNNGVNPLSALTGWDSHRLTHDAKLAPQMKRLMTEAAAAARADDVVLGDDDVTAMFTILHELDAIKTSMLVDREHGRPLELDAICGAVLARAHQLGEDAPGTELVMALLKNGIWAGGEPASV